MIADLMDLIRTRPREGFRRLYEEFAPRLKGYLIKSFGIDGQEAEDIIHDAFLPWVESPGRMETVNNPAAYLFTAVRNGYLGRRRRLACRAAAHDPLAGSEPNAGRWEMGGGNPDGVSSADPAARIDEQAVLEALGKLPPEQREAVALRVWGGMSLAEGAEHQGVPLQTFASRYRAGLGKMKELLGWAT